MAVAVEPPVEPFPVIRLCNVPKDDRPDWLIEGLWTRQAVGIVGGHPKLGKTWLALELALAIASGRPCLGRFAVHDRGPVLVGVRSTQWGQLGGSGQPRDARAMAVVEHADAAVTAGGLQRDDRTSRSKSLTRRAANA